MPTPRYFLRKRYCQFSDSAWRQNKDHVRPSPKLFLVKKVPCSRGRRIARSENSAGATQWSDGRQLLFWTKTSPHWDLSITPGLLHPRQPCGGQGDPRHSEALYPQGGGGQQCRLCGTNTSVLCRHKSKSWRLNQTAIRCRFETFW